MEKMISSGYSLKVIFDFLWAFYFFDVKKVVYTKFIFFDVTYRNQGDLMRLCPRT